MHNNPRFFSWLLAIIFFSFSIKTYSQSSPVLFKGFMNFTYDADTGKVLLEISDLDKEFIYVNSLAAGVGSNDIGLDRGQLGKTRLVKFQRAGDKIFLIEPNLKFRAVSENKAEVAAIEEAFASSVLWGFKIVKKENNKFIVDITDFLLNDAHDIVQVLTDKKQGTYKVEKTRSAIYTPNTKSFPDNSEFESIITYVGTAKGKEIKSVTPTPDIVTVRLHHSFVRLPDSDYKPRMFHPFSGYFDMSYADYAVPIHEPIERRFITRHRLEKLSPSANQSEAKNPIVYYIDRGCPEPIKSALMEGASWWNQAFEAAGYLNAFQVRELPPDAHPLDVRYNMIQWVHRSTRGWSYGSSVTDPRTGEIIKGHVSLGSLRVRQDFMIAQGILSPYEDGDDQYSAMTEIALARLKQLAAHEVGHTLGLSHNFAASVNNRSSVMDYPHPLILSGQKPHDLSKIYDNKIGDWDKYTILYGYQDFGVVENEKERLNEIVGESQKMGFKYMSDPDARPMGSAHPYAHLWDNGTLTQGNDNVGLELELNRLIELRADALLRFGENTIPSGMPYSELEKILVPLFLMHRYQAEAVSKIIGGQDYSYAVKDGRNHLIHNYTEEEWQPALKSLLKTLDPAFLTLPDHIIKVIPPPADGHRRNNESFKTKTGLTMDPLSMAESSAAHTLSLLLHPERLARINQATNKADALPRFMNILIEEIFATRNNDNMLTSQISMMTQKIFVIKLIELVRKKDVDHQVRAVAMFKLNEIQKEKLRDSGMKDNMAIHKYYLNRLIEDGLDLTKTITLPEIEPMPPGSPIGCDH